MEETLGKRICAGRKRLGLTQDALAEKLGLTAQAVSKWENDLSCPDIAMLPRLAQIFGITTDELLGMEAPKVHTAEIVTENDQEEPEGFHFNNGGEWELKWDSGRRTTLGLAIWIFLSGALLLLTEAGLWGPGFHLSLWDILLPSAALVFGLFGLYPKFSVFRLGCALVGGYYLLSVLNLIPFSFSNAFFLPLFLMLFGLKLLSDAAGKPKHNAFHVIHDGKHLTGRQASYCHMDGERFECVSSFGEKRHLIQLPRLAGGGAQVSFGEMILDLTGCQELAENTQINLTCSFGELEVLVPRQWRAVPISKTSFAALDTQGSPAPDAEMVLNLTCDVSFGEITIRYI